MNPLHAALFVALALLVVAAVYSLTLVYDLGACGSAPICGPLRDVPQVVV